MERKEVGKNILNYGIRLSNLFIKNKNLFIKIKKEWKIYKNYIYNFMKYFERIFFCGMYVKKIKQRIVNYYYSL